MAWSQVGSTTGASGTTSAAPSKPTGTASGNLLFAAVLNDNAAGGTITLPSGWSSIVTFTTGSDLRQTVAGKIADGTEGSTFSFSRSGASFMAANVSCFSGNHASTIANAFGAGNTGTSSTQTASAITTTTASTLLAYFGFPNTGSAMSPPSGMTEILDAPSGFGYVAWETRVATGSTGTREPASAPSVEYLCVLVAFEPTVELPVYFPFRRVS